MAGPLDGYTVLDLSMIVAGPMATMLLADQGAHVIKIEPTIGGDPQRVPAFAKGGLSAYFLNVNRGKRSIAVDLGTDAGRQIVLELCATADVFVQNSRPGVMDRLGLGYSQVAAVNADIVYLSISGFGPDGPYADRPVLDPLVQGLCGIIDRQLNPEIPFPDLIRNLYADKSTALTAAQAVTAALLARERGHGGQHVELSLLDSCTYFFWPDGMADLTLLDDDVSGGTRLGEVYSLTRCSDGFIVYFAVSAAHRSGVAAALGHPEWSDDPRFTREALIAEPTHAELLGSMMAAEFADLTCDEAVAALRGNDVPVGRILTAHEAVVDPQLAHNQTLVEWQHPDAGRVRQPRPAARFHHTATEMPLHAPQLGQHTTEVLAEIGRSEAEIDALRASGVIG